MSGRMLADVACLSEAEFRRDYLAELENPAHYVRAARGDIFLFEAGIEKFISLLCMRGRVTAALAVREALGFGTT